MVDTLTQDEKYIIIKLMRMGLNAFPDTVECAKEYLVAMKCANKLYSLLMPREED